MYLTSKSLKLCRFCLAQGRAIKLPCKLHLENEIKHNEIINKVKPYEPTSFVDGKTKAANEQD